MKAILEFDLTRYEERREHEIALNGENFLNQLFEIDSYLRNKIKYDENLTKETEEILAYIREQITIEEFL